LIEIGSYEAGRGVVLGVTVLFGTIVRGEQSSAVADAGVIENWEPPVLRTGANW
jgi:hypothetical protein